MADAERPMEFLTLSLFSLETGEKRRITSPPAGVWSGDSCPAFSPDGRRLAFSRWTAWAISDLYLVDLSPDLKPLAELKRLTSGNWGAASPAWTADGKSLIFSNLSGGESSLWRVDASGSSKPERLATLGGPAAYPAISHHGNRLAYAQETMHECIWRIEIPTPGGKAKRPEKFISSTRNDDFPEFSPDGRRIAFGSDRSGSWEIWICDADGSNPVQLTSLGGQNFVIPRWSPDSRRLAFYAKIEGRSEVYVINASGGSPQRLTFGPIGSEAPSWSRDGHWILFNSSTQPPDIYKMPAEGGPAVLVRHTPAPGWWAPRESPDGKFIYFNQDTAGGLSNVVRVPIGGGEEQLVLNSPYCFLYALVEDGIYFIPKPDPKSGYSIQFLKTTTGKIQRIASLENPPWAPTVSPDRRWMLFGQREPGHSNLMLVENFR
jgi:Tol biopolymer transport system component